MGILSTISGYTEKAQLQARGKADTPEHSLCSRKRATDVAFKKQMELLLESDTFTLRPLRKMVEVRQE
jgi:hypothetical protein